MNNTFQIPGNESRHRNPNALATGRGFPTLHPVKATYVTILFAAAVWAANGAPPPNDNFASRIVIPSVPAEISGTTIDGTLEPGEPQAYHQLSTVWYEWIALTNGILRVRLTGSSNLMVGTIYSGNALADLSRLDGLSSLNEAVEANVDVQPGVAYQFRIAPDQGTPYPRLDGPFTLRLEYNTPPPNDHFTNRIRLTNRVESVSFRNVAATLEPWETALGTGRRTVWYQWRAPENGTVRLETTTYGTGVVGVYFGTDDSLGILLTNSTDRCGAGVTFNAVAGQFFQLVFDNCGSTDRNRPFGHSWTLSLNGASRWENVSRETNGWMALTLSGDAARTYVLEGSADQTNWIPLETNAAATASRTFRDFTATNASYRFYRARVLE